MAFRCLLATATPTRCHMSPAKVRFPTLNCCGNNGAKPYSMGGNCPCRFREIFGEAPKKGRSVRFDVYWEQCVQLHHVGLAKLHDSIINHCIQMKWAEKACLKFAAAASKSEVLALVECCAASSAGKEFCHGTYWLIGGSVLVPSYFSQSYFYSYYNSHCYC